jgi:hypothetical protein
MCDCKAGSPNCTAIVKGIQLAEDASAGHQVVDDDWSATGDIANNMGGFCFGNAGTAFVHDHQRQVERFGVATSQTGATDIRADHRSVAKLGLVEIGGQERDGGEWVNWDVEKSLDGPVMDIDKYYPACALRLKQVGDYACADRLTAMRHTILPSVREVGNHYADAVHAGPAEGIQVQQQLDQAVVNRLTTGLHQKNILIADNFLDLDMDFTIW